MRLVVMVFIINGFIIASKFGLWASFGPALGCFIFILFYLKKKKKIGPFKPVFPYTNPKH
jgi:hypothetical protein